MDPRIGQLMKEGRIVFYAFVNGYDKPEVTGTLEEIEYALGLRDEVVALKEQAKARPAIRTWVVTITPKITTYASGCTFGAYDVEVDARTYNLAIKAAADDRRESEGAHGVPATYTAKAKGE